MRWIQRLPPEVVREPGLRDTVRLVLGKLVGYWLPGDNAASTAALRFLQPRMHLIKRKEGRLADTFSEVAFSMP